MVKRKIISAASSCKFAPALFHLLKARRGAKKLFIHRASEKLKGTKCMKNGMKQFVSGKFIRMENQTGVNDALRLVGNNFTQSALWKQYTTLNFLHRLNRDMKCGFYAGGYHENSRRDRIQVVMRHQLNSSRRLSKS